MRPRKLLVLAALLGALALPLPSAMGAGARQRININTASVEQLETLPGIGPAKARAIVAHRRQKPFATVDELSKVRGIGDRLLEQLRDRVTVGSDAEPQRGPGPSPSGDGS